MPEKPTYSASNWFGVIMSASGRISSRKIGSKSSGTYYTAAHNSQSITHGVQKKRDQQDGICRFNKFKRRVVIFGKKHRKDNAKHMLHFTGFNCGKSQGHSCLLLFFCDPSVPHLPVLLLLLLPVLPLLPLFFHFYLYFY